MQRNRAGTSPLIAIALKEEEIFRDLIGLFYFISIISQLVRVFRPPAYICLLSPVLPDIA
jgi:hypothetical protein